MKGDKVINPTKTFAALQLVLSLKKICVALLAIIHSSENRYIFDIENNLSSLEKVLKSNLYDLEHDNHGVLEDRDNEMVN